MWKIQIPRLIINGMKVIKCIRNESFQGTLQQHKAKLDFFINYYYHKKFKYLCLRDFLVKIKDKINFDL